MHLLPGCSCWLKTAARYYQTPGDGYKAAGRGRAVYARAPAHDDTFCAGLGFDVDNDTKVSAMIDDVIKDAEDRMNKAVKALSDDLQSIRTGRASPALIEHLKVEYYGMPTPLQQLAMINVPEPRILAVKPFSPGDIGAIERAILKSDLGLNPSNDGKIIRLIIPQLTEERRRDLVKHVARRTEEGRVAVRNIRRDAIDDMRAWEKEGEISEDDLHIGQDKVQKLTDRYIKRIDEVGQKKEAEVLEV